MFCPPSPNRGGTCTRPAEIGIDDFQAKSSPDERYRTSPLKGLWTHRTGSFYHDGRFATLLEVSHHYDDSLDKRGNQGERNAGSK